MRVNKKRLLITGSSGFLGRNLCDSFFHEDLYEIFPVSSKDYNLLSFSQTEKMFKDLSPNIVIHLAAYSGGILANKKYPADFYFKNTILTANVFECSANFNIDKLIYPMGGCSYPATAKSPIEEDDMWNGFPQEESSAYSTSKKQGIIASKAYYSQYNLKSNVIIPGNMYGPYDNFHKNDSHVIPAVIRKLYEAKIENKSELIFWGSGNAQRDFVYVSDVAKIIWCILDSDTLFPNPLNISSGSSIKIKDLVKKINNFIGFNGEIKWDISKPEGQLNKIFSVKKLNDLGYSCDTSIDNGLKKTVEWFKEHYNENSVLLRL